MPTTADGTGDGCCTMIWHEAAALPWARRLTRAGEFVPIGPATCCKLCLSETVHPIAGCYDLNFCSGHGMCTLGSCQCLRGWSGADCSVQVRRTQRAGANLCSLPLQL